MKRSNVGDSLRRLRVNTREDSRTREHFRPEKYFLVVLVGWAGLPKPDKAKTAKKGHFWVCQLFAKVLPENHSQQLPKIALFQMRTVLSQPLKMMLFIRATGDKEGIEATKKPTFLILLK